MAVPQLELERNWLRDQFDNAINDYPDTNNIRLFFVQGVGKTTKVAEFAASGQFQVILVIPTHGMTEGMRNFENMLVDHKLENIYDFRHSKAKRWAACSMCSKWDAISERNIQDGRILKPECIGCEKKLCTIDEIYHEFPGCVSEVSDKPEYVLEMLVKFTQLNEDEITDKLVEITIDAPEKMIQPEIIHKKVSMAKVRGNYEFIISKQGAKLVCSNHQSCDRQKQFHNLENVQCDIVPFNLLAKVLSELDKIENKKRPICIVFEESPDKEIYAKLGLKMTESDLQNFGIEFTPYGSAELKTEIKNGKTIGFKNHPFYRCKLKRQIEVYNRETNKIREFFNSHNPIIFYRHKNKATGQIYGKFDLRNLVSKADLRIFNCATTSLSLMKSMTDIFDGWKLLRGSMNANKLPNKSIWVKSYWSRRHVESNFGQVVKLALSMKNVLDANPDKRVFVITKKAYISSMQSNVLIKALNSVSADVARIDFVTYGRARGSNRYERGNYAAAFIVGHYRLTQPVRQIYRLMGLTNEDINNIEDSEVLHGIHRIRCYENPHIPIFVCSDNRAFAWDEMDTETIKLDRLTPFIIKMFKPSKEVEIRRFLEENPALKIKKRAYDRFIQSHHCDQKTFSRIFDSVYPKASKNAYMAPAAGEVVPISYKDNIKRVERNHLPLDTSRMSRET